jgi:hypothetical protein
MGFLETFLAACVLGLSAVNAAIPLAAYVRTHERRFWFVLAGNLGLALLGALWVWGSAGGSAPASLAPTDPILAVALIAVLLFLAAAVFPRRP